MRSLPWVFLVGIAALIYIPGLNGPFLFDDYANLDSLGQYGGVRNVETLILYLKSGTAGPTGRPISLLSFLLNSTTWPADPWPFKFTNLILHLLTGVILYQLVFRLLSASSVDDTRATWTAAMTAGCWLFHPLNVSTVLYVVQRMAMLSAFFVLLGVLIYVVGRKRLLKDTFQGHVIITVAIGLCTPLAVFSKENGCLLPTLVLIIEYVVLRRTRLNHAIPHPIWSAALLWGPTAYIFFYLGRGILTGRFQSAFSSRPFTMGERVLTEARILVDYLYHWYIPHFQNRGLFGEDYPLSTGLFNPITTLAAVIVVSTLIVVAWAFRQRFPWMSLAVLFYFVGHIIESTVIPLELYFEHRNYLPAVFLFLPVSWFIVNHLEKKSIYKAVAIVLLAIPATMTASTAKVWSSDIALALSWARENPTSQRAQRSAALVLEAANRPDLALLVLEKAQTTIPDSIAVKLHFLLQKCLTQGVAREEIENGMKMLETLRYDFRTFEFLQSVVLTTPTTQCKGFEFADTHDLLNALAKNPGARNNTGAQRQIHHLRGRLSILENKSKAALRNFEKAFKLRPDPDAGMLETALLANQKMYEAALSHLDTVRNEVNSRSVHPKWKLDYSYEIDRLESAIKSSMANSGGSPTSR